MTGEEIQEGTDPQKEPRADWTNPTIENQPTEEIQPKAEEPVAEEKQKEAPSVKSTLSPESAKIVEAVEGGISDRLDSIVAGINQTLASLNQALKKNAEDIAAIQQKNQNTFAALPDIINDHLSKALPAIQQEIGSQLGEKLKATLEAGGGAGGGNGAGGGLSVQGIAKIAPQIIEIINAWKQPTTEQAMMGQMQNIFKWHQLLTKLEKGGGSASDITSQIADTFNPAEKQEG